MRQRRSILISTAAGITAALTGCLDQDENEDDDSTTSADDAEEGDDDATDQTTNDEEPVDDEDNRESESTGGADTAVGAVEGYAMAAEAGNFEEMLSYFPEEYRQNLAEEDLEQETEFIDAEEKGIEFSAKLAFLNSRQVPITDQSEFLTEEQLDQYLNEWEQEASEVEPDAEAEVDSVIENREIVIAQAEETVDAADSQIVGVIVQSDPSQFTDDNGFQQTTLVTVQDRQTENWFVVFG